MFIRFTTRKSDVRPLKSVRWMLREGMREAISLDATPRRLQVVMRATLLLQDEGEASVYKFIIPAEVPGPDTWETSKDAFREELEFALDNALPPLVLEMEAKFVDTYEVKEGYSVKVTLGWFEGPQTVNHDQPLTHGRIPSLPPAREPTEMDMKLEFEHYVPE